LKPIRWEEYPAIRAGRRSFDFVTLSGTREAWPASSEAEWKAALHLRCNQFTLMFRAPGCRIPYSAG